jgi:hypothetical protein
VPGLRLESWALVSNAKADVAMGMAVFRVVTGILAVLSFTLRCVASDPILQMKARIPNPGLALQQHEMNVQLLMTTQQKR